MITSLKYHHLPHIVIDTNIVIHTFSHIVEYVVVMAVTNKDIVLAVSLVLSLISLVLLFGVTWYFQSSLDLLQQQVKDDRELLLKLQEQIHVRKCVRI